MKIAEQIDARFDAGKIDEFPTELDERFHVMLAETARHPRLREEIERWKVEMTWAQLSTGLSKANAWKGESHVKLVRAVATGDPDIAEKQMRQHIQHPWLDWKQETLGRDAAD